jgi:CHAT domain-containing protein
VADGECVHGLQLAFHVAGCKNVVASLWNVPDQATTALMAVFYDELLTKHRPPLEALRQA